MLQNLKTPLSMLVYVHALAQAMRLNKLHPAHMGIYNPGKNGWYTLSDLGEKGTPFPQHIVDLSHGVRILARSPNIDLMGLGRIMVKARTPLLSIKQCHVPFSTSVISMGIVVPTIFFHN